eukprot:2674465-Pyramimonas_sp.AAC.1
MQKDKEGAEATSLKNNSRNTLKKHITEGSNNTHSETAVEWQAFERNRDVETIDTLQGALPQQTSRKKTMLPDLQKMEV